MTTVSFAPLAERIETLASTPPDVALPDDAESVVAHLLAALERGEVRSATRESDGAWRAVPWVKRGILLGFRAGRVVPMPDANGAAGTAWPTAFFDKHTIPPRALALGDGVRVVPGGTSIRRGSYVAPGVVCMPPVFINVGAYVGAGTMVDSHALVGSCAQIGERVHLSAAAQIGGVLEPVGALPVIVEDDVLVGGNCGVYEGTVVKRRAVLAAGTVITGSTPIYDIPNNRVIEPAAGGPLVVPEGAVVVPGSRPIAGGPGRDWGLALATPVIVKYRDERTSARTALEQWIR